MFPSKLSHAAAYALVALNQLGERGATPVANSTLCRTTGIPDGFVGQVMTKLVKAGFVHATLGVAGGYVLAKKRKDITVWDVVHAVDKSTAGKRTVDLRGLRSESARKVHAALAKVDADVQVRLSRLKLSQL